jgi:hypothetical protein
LLRSLLGWAGAIVTIALTIIAATATPYRAEQCFVSSAQSGCSSFVLSFNEMLARFPLQLAAPLVLLAALSLCSIAAALLAGAARRSRVVGGGFVGAHAVLALPLAYALPQPFFAAVPLLGAAYAGSLLDLIVAGAVVVLSWIGGAITLETLYRFIGPIYPFLTIAQAYWGFATALGVGAGAIACAVGRRLPMSRALLGAFLTAGASALVAHAALERIFYPNRTYVTEGMSPFQIFAVVVLSLAVPNLVLAPFALRAFLAASWRAAFTGTLLAFAGAAVALAIPITAGAIMRPTGG